MNPIKLILSTCIGFFAAASVPMAALAQQAGAGVYAEGKLPDAYSAEGHGISYFNTPNRKHTQISASEPTAVGQVSLKLAAPADVLVQFTGGIAVDSPDGCPCSVRAALKVDDQPLVVIKRVNLGTLPAQAGTDRQSVDGSFVVALPAGAHSITLFIHEVDGTSKSIEMFYTNIQAIPFSK